MQCGELASRLKWTRVVVLIPHKDDVWDLGLKIRFPGVMSDFYILIDFKSKREFPEHFHWPAFLGRTECLHMKSVMKMRYA